LNIDAGAFKDLAGNNYAGISATTTWAFTTQAPPAATVTVNPTSLSFGFVAAGSSSAAQTFTYTTTNITSSLTLTAPSGFELSAAGTTFTSSVVYSQAEKQADKTGQPPAKRYDFEATDSASVLGTHVSSRKTLRGAQVSTSKVGFWAYLA